MAQPTAKRAPAGDPVIVDSTHYRVEAETDEMRILRARYEPKSKSVMHSHPASVAICLTDATCRFTFPDGRTEDHNLKAGQVMTIPAMDHQPENLGTTPFEVIVVELKK